jgi:hypothetical protein
MKLPAIAPTPMSMDDFICHLVDLGYRRLGSGSYATVYGIPDTNHVCKVGFVDGTIAEDGCLRFISKMNKTNPLFPKVEAVGIFHCTSADLDRHPTCTCKEDECICNMNDFDEYYVVHMEKLAAYDAIPYAKRDVGLNTHGIDSIYELEEWSLKESPIKNPSKPLAAAIKILRKLYQICSEDIHCGNVMWRNPDDEIPQLVITDPVA